jgi:hypothetical protein
VSGDPGRLRTTRRLSTWDVGPVPVLPPNTRGSFSNPLCFENLTFIKLHPRVGNRTDGLGHVRILMVRNWGAVGAVLEVLIIERRPTKWEWRVCDRYGTIMGGFESTQPAAKYRGNSALFLLLSTRRPGDRGHRDRVARTALTVRQFQSGAPFSPSTENESLAAVVEFSP